MKKITLLILTTITIVLTATAGLKRVGFSGSQITGVDFTTVQLAHDNAGTLAGDTIQVYPGISGGSFFQTKKLIIIGIGYLTTGTNSNTNLNVLTTQNPIDIGIVYYNSTSSAISGSEYHGVTLRIGIAGNIGTSISNITIQRCAFGDVFNGGGATGTINNLKFKQCSSISGAGVANVTLSNCLIENSILNQTSFFGTNAFSLSSSFYIKNCIAVTNTSFGQSLDFGSYAILAENCIFQSTFFANYANTTFNNCFLTNNTNVPLVPAVNGTNNTFNINSNNGAMFIGYPTQGTTSNDGRFMLKAGSPAIGYGTGGVDCGVFGNINPYKLSGIPATPAFYKLTAPSTNTSTNPYQITFSVRSNN